MEYDLIRKDGRKHDQAGNRAQQNVCEQVLDLLMVALHFTVAHSFPKVKLQNKQNIGNKITLRQQEMNRCHIGYLKIQMLRSNL